MKSIGLYIHIPFCRKKCLYCDFNSYENMDAYKKTYTDALIKELKYYLEQEEYRFRTVYIGGGTPTNIDSESIVRIIKTVEKNIEKDAEITIECNPGTVDERKIKIYKALGINRVSIGLQAWQDQLLKGIGRIHKREDFLQSLDLLRKHGFNNINVDLMFSLPNQTKKMWEETLENICALDVEHVSCYSLTIEDGTPIYELIRSGRLQMPDDDADRKMYKMAKDILEKKGLYQYEISNFAKKGFSCVHNLIYWNNEEYLGVGAGSHSKIGMKRFWNHERLEDYIKNIANHKVPVKDSQNLSLEEDLWETIILGLRLNSGISIDEINKKYNINFIKKYEKAIKKLSEANLIQIKFDRISLTEKGRDISNSVFIEFMD